MIVKLLNENDEWINTDKIASMKPSVHSKYGTVITLDNGITFYEESKPGYFLSDLQDIRKGTMYANRKLNPHHPTEI